MSIPTQLPQLVAAARSGALQALALQSGQMLDGKVIGPAPNGGTQVQIANQLLNLVLPTLVRPGDMLKFQVQGSGAQLKLAMQPLPPAAAPATLPAASPAPVHAQPNTLPLPAGQPPVASPPAVQASAPQTTPAVAPSPAPQPAVTPATPSLPTAQAAPATPMPSSPIGTPPATPAGAPPPATPNAPPPQPTVVQPAISSVVSQAQAATQMPAGTAPQMSPQATVVPVPQQPYPVVAPRAAIAQAAPAPVLAAAPSTGATAAPPQAPAQPATQQSTSPPLAATRPSTPAAPATVAQMVQAALPRQDSIAGLTTALASIAGKVVLPEPVVRAAQQVLAGRVAIDGGRLDGATLQKAILRSGVFQEAALLRPGTPLAPQADMKAALLTLRQTLSTWLGPQAPLAQASQMRPPIRGQVPRARAVDAPPIDPRAGAEEVGKQLLERTEAALSRVRLHQSASLPDPIAKTADWSMDLPVVVGQQQAMLQIQIHRDEQDGAQATAERGWQMRFAINLPGMGEVGAQVSLRGGTTGVMLWATERETSEALEADAAALRDTLVAAGLRPGAVIVRHGEPPTPPPAPSGHFVDAST